MNPEQFLTKVQILLAGAHPVEPGIYTLYLKDDQPLIEHGDKRPNFPNVLALLRSRDINTGLTTHMWTNIHDRFAIFQKRGLI